MAADAGGVHLSQGTNWGQQRWPRNQGSLLVMKGRAENRDAEPAERATAVRTPLACFSQGHSQHAGGVPTVRCRLLRGLGPRLIGCSRGSRPRLYAFVRSAHSRRSIKYLNANLDTIIYFHQLAFNAGYRLSCALARTIEKEVARCSYP